MNENTIKLAEGGSQLIEPFLTRDISTFGDGPKVDDILDGTYSPPPESTDATIAFLEAPPTHQYLPQYSIGTK